MAIDAAYVRQRLHDLAEDEETEQVYLVSGGGGDCQRTLSEEEQRPLYSIEIKMPNVAVSNGTGPSAKRTWPLMAIVAGGTGLLILLAICFLPYWFEEYIRRGKEEHTRHQMAEVKAGKTTSISDPAPEVIGELVKDRECADKITEVNIGEITGSRITDERFRA